MSHIEPALKQTLNVIQSIEAWICSVVWYGTTLLIVVHVVNRQLLHFPIMWFHDLALYSFIFFMFIAAALATWQETHVKVDAFHEMAFRGKPRAGGLHRVLMTFIAIALICIFLPVAYDFMTWALKYPEYGTLVRWFNMSWLRIVLFIVVILILVHLLRIAIRDVSHLREIWRSKPHK
ncbi:TRAP transporter small permease [Chloroflexota bacterium]